MGLLNLSKELSVPVVISEQYSQGLKPTIPELQNALSDPLVVHKVHFSCASDANFISTWQSLNRKQAILMGIETHVCVLQTALELKERGYDVFVVGDAVSARHELDHQLALKRMKQNGIQIVSKEMVFFEWVRQAGTEQWICMCNRINSYN